MGCNRMEQKKERHSNLELLRILAALFVIVVHYVNPDIGKAFAYTEGMPSHYKLLLIAKMFSICAVNIFVMISGYFSCTSMRVRVWKVIRLYIDVIFFRVLMYVMSCIFGNIAFSMNGFLGSFLPVNWYVAVYSGLYLISPYLNRIMRDLPSKQFQTMLLVFFFVFSIWPSGIDLLGKVFDFSSKALTPISSTSSGDGYTLVNFILIYSLGAYFRLHENKAPSVKKSVCGLLWYFGITVINTLYAAYSPGRAAAYCNPLVVLQTAALFVAFQNIRIQNNVINIIASCSFGTYLMHEFFFPYCQIEKYVTGSLWMVPLHAILCAALIYVVCALIYGAYQKLFAPVFGWLQQSLRFLSYDTDSPIVNS